MSLRLSFAMKFAEWVKEKEIEEIVGRNEALKYRIISIKVVQVF